MEQLRRTSALSTSYEVHFDAIHFDTTTIIPFSQEKFLSNRRNKKNFIEMLIKQLQTANIATKQARDDADVLITETAIEVSEQQWTAIIIGEDIDLLVILIGRTQSHQQEIFLKKMGKGNVETRIYSSKSFDKYPRCKEHILFLHAFSGCDTTSALFNRGKLQILKMFEKHPELLQLAQPFQQENSPQDTLFENGIRFLLAIYNAPKLEKSIDNFRYTHFIKSTRLNRPVKLSSLPPTSEAARQHIYRVYYQIQTWLGNDLQPTEWGWSSQNEILEPKTTSLPPAPDELLSRIFCNCTKGCGAKCGCRKVGLQCSTVCGQCRGQACFNASPNLYNLDEENEFESEIILESSMAKSDDDSNNSNLELGESEKEDDDNTASYIELGQPEEEDDDEEEEC